VQSKINIAQYLTGVNMFFIEYFFMFYLASKDRTLPNPSVSAPPKGFILDQELIMPKAVR
jgi:hypothetical protein